MRSRWIKITAGIILAVFLGLVWTAEARKTETIDEPLFIGAGVAQVELLDPNLDVSHPPLLRLISGLSARYFGGARHLPQPAPLVPRGAINLYTYKLQDAFDWSAALLYDAGNDHDRTVFWGRFPFAFFGALAGVLLLFEVRRRFGDVPAIAALAVFCFTPEILAHAQWAHSDLPSAACLLLTAFCLARALETPICRNDLYLGLALGATVTVKMTGILLLPVIFCIVALWNRPEQGSRFKFALLRLARVTAALWFVIVTSYLPEPRLFDHRFLPIDLARIVGGASEGARVHLAAAALHWLPLPDTFLKGLVYTALLGQHGQIAFFHGELRSDGWWYYFPAAMILKYPTPLLIVAACGFVATLRSKQLSAARKLAWSLPPLVLFGFAMAQKINIGVRSVLTIAPFLALWSAAALAAARARVVRYAALAAVALSIASGISAWPNFLSWFNPLFGGTAAADKWLTDSNLDWGQDLPELARLLRARGNPEVHLAYWGWARPERWGIRAVDFNQRTPGYYAVSRSYFSGIWGHEFDWLRDLPVEEYAGGSIALINVRPQDLPKR
jgi:4-amino-4-deoxy-L-arabinose transferase-like glycosyltransferase